MMLIPSPLVITIAAKTSNPWRRYRFTGAASGRQAQPESENGDCQ